ncbi:MAG TPA: hypothetical protein ENK81_02935 [Euryarchaeota archaeon]|nr:hypothetical protein [Euryarchaeota archaeon]
MTDVISVVKKVREDIEKNGIDEQKVLEAIASIDTKGEIRNIVLVLSWGGPNIIATIVPPVIKIEGFWGGNYFFDIIDNNKLANELFDKFASYFEGIEVKASPSN